LFALIGLLQLIQGFDSPATNSLIPAVVDKDNLQRVNGYARSAGNIVGIAGPTLGGAMYAWAGAGSVFIFNGCSFALVLFFVAALRVPRRQIEAGLRSSVWANSAAGLRYARSEIFILAILCLAIIDSMIGRAIEIVLVPLTTVTAHMGSSGLGLAYSALTFGAVAGALLATRLRKQLGRPATIILSYAALAVPLFAVAAMAERFVILAGMFVMGLVMDMFAVSLMTTLQRLVAPDYLGRVTALYGSALALGALPLAFGIAPIVSALSVRGTFALSGIIIAGTCIVLAAVVRGSEPVTTAAPESDE
jgi:MFS family permease